MPEHQIRLRAGWQIRDLDAPDDAAVRFVLPTRWPGGARRRYQLIRQFQRPRLDDDEEAVLRIEQAPGIRSIAINGQAWDGAGPARDQYEIPLGPESQRYRVVLDVETPEPCEADGPSTAAEWGVVALVVRPARTSET